MKPTQTQWALRLQAEAWDHTEQILADRRLDDAIPPERGDEAGVRLGVSARLRPEARAVRLQEGEAGQAQEGAADRAEYCRRTHQEVAALAVVRRRPHSRSKTEGRLCSESSIGANTSHRNICRHRTRPICQSQIGHPDNSPLSCPAGAVLRAGRVCACNCRIENDRRSRRYPYDAQAHNPEVHFHSSTDPSRLTAGA